MKLVEQEEAAAASSGLPRVALLVFTGVQIIDFTGPYEIFGTAGYDVYTVAETKDPITTVNGMTVVPKYDFATAPPPDVLVVPGGGIYAASNSAKTIQWIADVTTRTKHTMSVCNGAFLLAQAGLLDGLTATTTAGLIEKLRAQYPKVHVVDDRRFVDNGKIITTAGLSAGIDGALHVVARMQGNGKAQLTALGDEYDWKPEPGFARASLADRNIPDLDPEGKGQWTVESTRGGIRSLGDRFARAVESHGSRGRGRARGGPLRSRQVDERFRQVVFDFERLEVHRAGRQGLDRQPDGGAGARGRATTPQRLPSRGPAEARIRRGGRSAPAARAARDS